MPPKSKQELEDEVKKWGEQHKKLRGSHQKILSETVPSVVDRKRKTDKQIETLQQQLVALKTEATQFETVIKNLRTQAEKDDKAADAAEVEIMKLQKEIAKLK